MHGSSLHYWVLTVLGCAKSLEKREFCDLFDQNQLFRTDLLIALAILERHGSGSELLLMTDLLGAVEERLISALELGHARRVSELLARRSPVRELLRARARLAAGSRRASK